MSLSMRSPKFFSPEGRLYQVEYAIEAVARAAACVGILARDGIVLASEIENQDPLMDMDQEVQPGRIYKLNQNNACAVAGSRADGQKLVAAMLKISQRHENLYGEIMPTERMVERICQKKQAYTMYGGKRPFGISVIYMGWDVHLGYQLYQSDPSGIYVGWRSICIGRNARQAQHLLDQELYGKPKPGLVPALEVAIKTLDLATDVSPINSSTIQLATLERNRNKTYFHILDNSDVQELCRLYSMR